MLSINCRSNWKFSISWPAPFLAHEVGSRLTTIAGLKLVALLLNAYEQQQKIYAYLRPLRFAFNRPST